LKKNILIFASDERATLELVNVVKELAKQEEINYFFLYSNAVSTQHPKYNLDAFNYDSNIESTVPKYSFPSLGCALPFIPDLVLITRENWLPEKEILLECKQAGSIIVNLENSSWLYNNIKTKLELLSRKSFPTNLIDVYLDHSKWVLETKELADWPTYKSKVIGVPKFDNLKDIEPVHKDKPIIIVYGSMEVNIRPSIINKLDSIEKNLTDKFQIYYRPHPKEFEDFSSDFENNYLKEYPTVTVIHNEQDLPAIVKASDINIGIYSSVMFYALLLDKKIVYIDSDISGVSSDLNIESFKGHEYNFWAPIINVSSFEEFVDKIGVDFIEASKQRNTYLENKIQKCLIKYTDNFSWIENNILSNNKELLSFYDEFADFKASQRVVQLIKTIINNEREFLQ